MKLRRNPATKLRFCRRRLTLICVLLNGFWLQLSSGFCPPRCSCTEELSPIVNCTGAGLQSIPIILSPRTKTLLLKGNSIRTLTHDELAFYQDLERLDLSGNQLTQIDKKAFSRLSKLSHLLLANNQLLSSSLEPGTFLGLSRLELLDLSGNQLHNLSVSLFAGDLRRLKVLNLAGNQIHAIGPKGFKGLDNLTDLILFGNRLRIFPTRPLRDLPLLHTLDLSKNDIKSIPAQAASRNRHLARLAVAENQVSKISRTALKRVSKCLTNLDLSKNRLGALPTPSFRHLTGLTQLDISGNSFTEIPTGAFEGLAGLTNLSIQNCSQLNVIDLNGFSGLISLKTLSLSHNPRLKRIHPVAFEKPNRIQKIDFSFNNLPDLPETLLNWQQLQSLRLEGNPWDCSTCHFRWISLVLEERSLAAPTKAIDNRPMCHVPYSMASTPLMDFSTKLNADCVTTKSTPGHHQLLVISISAVVATVLLITVLVAAACCFVARHRQRFERRRKFQQTDFSVVDPEEWNSNQSPSSTAQFKFGGKKIFGHSMFNVFTNSHGDDGKTSLLCTAAPCGAGKTRCRNSQRSDENITGDSEEPLYATISSSSSSNYTIIRQYPVPITEL